LRLREENWRRVFRDSERSKYLKGLLDKLSVKLQENNDITTSLNSIIRTAQCEDWRRFFILYKDTITICENRKIRHNSNEEIYLLFKERMSGYHAELRTFALYKKWRNENLNYSPFKRLEYNSINGSEKSPWVYFNDGYSLELKILALEICYSFNGEYRFVVVTRDNKEFPVIIKETFIILGYGGEKHDRVAKNILEKDVDAELAKVFETLKMCNVQT
jgi:hypothetical protein